jgi:hypothetical protein
MVAVGGDSARVTLDDVVDLDELPHAATPTAATTARTGMAALPLSKCM